MRSDIAAVLVVSFDWCCFDGVSMLVVDGWKA
jgi:hypothetical protein